MPSSSLSSLNSGKGNQEAYTNLTTVYQKDYIFNTHDINMTSNSLEYHDRSQDELQAARTILSLARGSTDDMVLNMGQIMMELDNAPKVNNSCEKRDTPYNTDINNTITELKTQGLFRFLLSFFLLYCKTNLVRDYLDCLKSNMCSMLILNILTDGYQLLTYLCLLPLV